MHVFVIKMALTGLFMPLVIFAPLHLKIVILVVDPSGIGSQGQYRQGELLFLYPAVSHNIALYLSNAASSWYTRAFSTSWWDVRLGWCILAVNKAMAAPFLSLPLWKMTTGSLEMFTSLSATIMSGQYWIALTNAILLQNTCIIWFKSKWLLQ